MTLLPECTGFTKYTEYTNTPTRWTSPQRVLRKHWIAFECNGFLGVVYSVNTPNTPNTPTFDFFVQENQKEGLLLPDKDQT